MVSAARMTLKNQFQTKLELSCDLAAGDSPSDLTWHPSHVKHIPAWIPQIDAIQEVKGLKAKLQVCRFSEQGILGHGDVHSCESRQNERVPSQISESSGRRNGKGAGVKV